MLHGKGKGNGKDSTLAGKGKGSGQVSVPDARGSAVSEATQSRRGERDRASVGAPRRGGSLVGISSGGGLVR